jgi:hypothetical protein
MPSTAKRVGLMIQYTEDSINKGLENVTHGRLVICLLLFVATQPGTQSRFRFLRIHIEGTCGKEQIKGERKKQIIE